MCTVSTYIALHCIFDWIILDWCEWQTSGQHTKCSTQEPFTMQHLGGDKLYTKQGPAWCLCVLPTLEKATNCVTIHLEGAYRQRTEVYNVGIQSMKQYKLTKGSTYKSSSFTSHIKEALKTLKTYLDCKMGSWGTIVKVENFLKETYSNRNRGVVPNIPLKMVVTCLSCWSSWL